MILLRSPSYGTTKRNRNLVYFLKPTDEMKYPNGGMNLYENLQFLFIIFFGFPFLFFVFSLYFLGMETFFLEIFLATYSKEFS